VGLEDRSTLALLLGLLAVLMAAYLVWLNVRGVRGKVRSSLCRIAIAAFSVGIIASMTVLAIMVGYLRVEGEAIPIVEKVGTFLLVIGVGAFGVSIVSLIAGAVARIVRRRRGS
jgi:hypothetical protein